MFFSGSCIRLCLFLKDCVHSVCRDTEKDDLLMVCMVLELFYDVQVVTSTYKVLLLYLFSSAVCFGFLCRLDLYVALFIAIHASFLTSCMP